MSFSEKLKKQVRQRAAYQCCRCRSFGVEVHHIIPQKNNGPNIISNAAPLCPNCHNDFGDNVEKRKVIREMRDWWYSTVKKMFTPSSLAFSRKIDKELYQLKNLTEKLYQSLTKPTSAAAADHIRPIKFTSDFDRFALCGTCLSTVQLPKGSNECPRCGRLLSFF